jgi:16S rRNA G527 N7-methylase RsmG
MQLSLSDLNRLAGHFEIFKQDLPSWQPRFEMILQYLQLRAQWAKVHNVSGPQALADSTDDVVDAFALCEILRRDLPLVDVGTGSGVPGMLLACLLPDLKIHLVEPLVKRTAFLNSVAYQLGLSSVKVWRERWPCLNKLPQADVSQGLQLVSRAVIAPDVWPTLACTEHTQVIYQYLAQIQPDWEVKGFEMKAECLYEVRLVDRIVRRWDRG